MSFMPRAWRHAKAMHEDLFPITDGEEDPAISKVLYINTIA